ncbi:phage capsid protein [uncultured Nitratireductor sp.]|uniref:phage capsid protein n=1 Tax=uncultured Nitratireductor sp. TaxID=520953 RepID=UPI0025CD173D|nr:phage capsid protein [uncultured Nitratireductor sp.]
MSLQAENWFREQIKDKVTIQYQAGGGYLDGTMMSGDTQAGLIKFPTAGRVEAYKLTGAIQLVQGSNPDLSMIEVKPDDFESSAWYRTQDIYKSGPSERDAIARLITKSIRRKRDNIKLDALTAFHGLGGIDTIGDGTTVIDLLDTEGAAAEIFGTGAGEDEDDALFCPLPWMWWKQMLFYKEFADARYAGPENIPFSKRTKQQMKTVQSVNYFPMPDEYFTGPDGTSLYSWIWARNAMGAETPWNKEAPGFTQHPEYEGSPWLIKAGMGGCAVGIQKEGVKRLHFKLLDRPERPVVKTEAVTP